MTVRAAEISNPPVSSICRMRKVRGERSEGVAEGKEGAAGFSHGARVVGVPGWRQFVCVHWVVVVVGTEDRGAHAGGGIVDESDVVTVARVAILKRQDLSVLEPHREVDVVQACVRPLWEHLLIVAHHISDADVNLGRQLDGGVARCDVSTRRGGLRARE